MTSSDRFELLGEVFFNLGDWLIVWWDEEFEGTAAMLHDTSSCPCHADAEFRCHDGSSDPTNLTRRQAELLIEMGVDSGG